MVKELIRANSALFITVCVLTGLLVGLFPGCTDPLQTEEETTVFITDLQFNYNKWSGEIYLSAMVEAQNDGVAVDSVKGLIFDLMDSTAAADTLVLFDNGSNGDILSGDNIYARVIGKDTTVLAETLDSIAVALIGYSVYAYYGETLVQVSDDYDLTNFTPSVTAVSMPEFMYIPCADAALLYDLDTLVVSVLDSNGLDDIQICYLNFEKPDGQLSSGSPIELYDDGYINNGVLRWDETANDGDYCHLILIDTNSVAGVYKAHYFARDIGGLISPAFTVNLGVIDTCSNRR